jgi:hypothetical protein
MKLSAALLALASLTLAVPALHADDISATVTTATGVHTVLGADILGVETFIYTDTSIVLGIPTLISDQTLTATYADVSGVLGVLNVTDVCAKVNLFGSQTPCSAIAFSFTDLSLPVASLGADLLIGATANVSGDLANINFGASIAGGSGDFNFGPPPSGGGGGNSPVPEPGTLSLMATGLLSAAGLVRKRFMA